MARTAPAPNIPPIPGMCPGVAVLAGGADGGGGSGKGGKNGKGKKGAGTGDGDEDASGDGKEGGEGCGDPVCPITGRMFLDLYDFGFAGPLVLKWLRVYNSRTSNEASDLGFGWSHAFSWRIRVRRKTVTVFDDNAKEQRFRNVPTTGDWVANRLGWRLRRGGDSFELWHTDGRRLSFGPLVGGFHHLTAVSDANGNQISLARDTRGRIETLTDSAGRAFQFEHHGDRIAAIQAPGMEVARYTYDSAGNLASFTDAEGFLWEYRYRGHLLVEHRLPTGLTYCYVYDGDTHDAWCVESWGERIGTADPALAVPIPLRPASGPDRRPLKGIHHVKFEYVKELRATEVTTALGGLIRYFGDQSGRVIKRVDELGGITEYFYDSNTGALVRETQPDGSERSAPEGQRNPEISFTSDGGRIVKFEDEDGLTHVFDSRNGAVTSRLYDARGNTTFVQHADGSKEQYDYDERGMKRSKVDRAGVLTQFRYDAHGNQIEIACGGNVERMEYDYFGRKTAHVDAAGNRTEFAWDRRSELIEKRLADGSAIRWQRDALRYVTQVDDDGRVTRFEYGGLHWLTHLEEPDGAAWDYRYDPHGHLVWLQNPRGEIATQEFDAANRQVGFTSFEGWSHQAGYDAVGRVTWKQTPVGRQVFAFDDRNRLEAIEQSDGKNVNLTYEPFTVELDGVAFKRETNRVGNVVSEVQAIHELRLHWQGGYCDAIVADVGVPMLRNRDRMGDIESIEAGGVLFAHFDRSPSSVLLQLGSALVLRKTYDALGQLAGQCVARLDRALDAEQRATRNDPGVLWWASYEWRGTRLVGEHFSDGRSIQYELDAGDRVRTRRVTRAGSVVEEERLHYDAVGAPLMPGARYDAVGRPIEIDGATLEYDDAGRLVRRVDGDRETTYEWSSDGDLLAVIVPDQTTRFRYDARGRRTAKRVYRENEVVKDVSYLWNNNCVQYEVDHTAARSRTYVRDDLSFAPIGHVDLVGSANEVVYYLSSPIGFPVSAVDATGREVWRAEPTTFGEARATGSVDIDVRFPNQHADEDVGLVYNFRRWYDPKLGLFISPDPELLEGNLIPRGYVENPTVQSDPLGLKQIPAADQLPTAAGFLTPGPFATVGTQGVPGFIDAGANAQNHNFSDSTRRAIDNAGFKHGCHSCGSQDPDPTGHDPAWKHFVPDHQPPVSATEHIGKKTVEGGVRLYPHCRRCSIAQSAQARNAAGLPGNQANARAQIAIQKAEGFPAKPSNEKLQKESDKIKTKVPEPKAGWPDDY